jgi:hypothetical protein
LLHLQQISSKISPNSCSSGPAAAFVRKPIALPQSCLFARRCPVEHFYNWIMAIFQLQHYRSRLGPPALAGHLAAATPMSYLMAFLDRGGPS